MYLKMFTRFLAFVLIQLSAIDFVVSAPSHHPMHNVPGMDYGGMTWMGWGPDTGMTAFASSGGGMGAVWGNPNDGGFIREELEPPPSDDKSSGNASPTQSSRDSQSRNDNGGNGGRAEASLNAWFPIMVGLYPSSSENGKRNNYDGESASIPSITAIANSVNHGEKGVASSHAVAYGGAGNDGRNNQGYGSRGNTPGLFRIPEKPSQHASNERSPSSGNHKPGIMTMAKPFYSH